MHRNPSIHLISVLALGGAFSWAGPAVAQEAPCGGWTASCAAVEVRAEGDRLILFSPNATAPDASAETSPSDRVRVLADRPGSTCDARTGGGCEDVTSTWRTAASTGAADPGRTECNEDDVWMARARGLERDDERCRRGPVAAYFLVGLPVGLYLLGPDDHQPLIDGGPGLEDPGAGLPGSGDDGGSAGDDAGGSSTGGDDGSSGGGTGGNSSGGDTGGGSSGGDTGGNGQGVGTTPGGGGGGDGSDGSDPLGGGLGLPTAERPPMSEVPEPISTTLFGLGLAGYAGAQLRKRRAGRIETEEASS